MPSSSNWSVHVRSTRDLADRMFVRGDVKGARMMLEAAAELEKLYTVAPNLISLETRHPGVSLYSTVERLGLPAICLQV